MDTAYTFTRNSIAYLSNGTQVAANQPRFEQGASGFGKAVLVEEGTENIHHEDLYHSFSGRSYFNVTDVERDGFIRCKRFERIAEGNAYFTVDIPCLPNTAYTLTFWIRGVNLSPDSYVGMYLSDDTQSSEYHYIYNYDLTDEFKKFTVTRITSESATKIVRASLHFGTDYIKAGEIIEVADWQLEQKPYATSFIDGTRAAESLAIPGDVLNPQEGEISVRAYVTKRIIDGGSWQGFLCNRFTSNEWGFYVARSNSTEKVQFRLRFKTFTQDFDSPISLQEGDWMLITLKWDVDTIKLLFNGVVGIETENIYNVTFADITYIGSHRGVSSFANTLFDDLRISNRARTDEEILEAYQSNKPLPVDEWTTAKLEFEPDIFPVLSHEEYNIDLSTEEYIVSLNHETYEIRLEVIGLAYAGSTITLKATFPDNAGDLQDLEDVTVKIYAPGKVLVETLSATFISTGVYAADYLIPGDKAGEYDYEFSGTLGSKTIVGRSSFDAHWR
jgi:hypothetical protein